jgi:hypothetical protein
MQPRRPPSLPPSCGVFSSLSSFPHFERDPHDPDIYQRAGTEEHASRSATSSGAARGDYEANGAVQMALDDFDCGLEEHPPRCSGWVDSFTPFMTQDTR